MYKDNIYQRTVTCSAEHTAFTYNFWGLPTQRTIMQANLALQLEQQVAYLG